MVKEKQIQIPISLYARLVKFAILDDVSDQELKEDLKKFMYEKAENNAKREKYTLSKSALTPEEREKARKEYLDMVGIPEEFRW